MPPQLLRPSNSPPRKSQKVVFLLSPRQDVPRQLFQCNPLLAFGEIMQRIEGLGAILRREFPRFLKAV